MPHFCSAHSCASKRTMESRSQGITFHRFPSSPTAKKEWEMALRREGFQATKYSVLCSKHFKPEDFDRTGQTVRLRDEVVPSVFNFPVHILQLPARTQTTSASGMAAVPLESDGCHVEKGCDTSDTPFCHHDHSYALSSASPGSLKDKLVQAEAKLEQLQRQLRRAKERKRQSKTTVKLVLSEMKKQNLITEDIQDLIQKLGLYADDEKRINEAAKAKRVKLKDKVELAALTEPEPVSEPEVEDEMEEDTERGYALMPIVKVELPDLESSMATEIKQEFDDEDFEGIKEELVDIKAEPLDDLDFDEKLPAEVPAASESRPNFEELYCKSDYNLDKSLKVLEDNESNTVYIKEEKEEGWIKSEYGVDDN